MSEPYIDVKDEETAEWAKQQYYSRLPTSPVMSDGYRDVAMRIVDIYKAKRKRKTVTTKDYSQPFVDAVEEPAKEYAEDIIGKIEGTKRVYTPRTPIRFPRRRDSPSTTVPESEHIVDAVEESAIKYGEEAIEKIEGTKTVYREPPKPSSSPSRLRRTRPYETAIDAVGDVEKEYGEKTIEKYASYTQAPIMKKDIGEMTVEKGVELREKAVKTFEEGKPWKGFGEYIAGVALGGGVSFVRGATTIVNPVAWARGIQDFHYLASTPDAQRRLGEQIARDPFSFAVDVGAGVAGGYYGGKFVKFLVDTPEYKEYVKTETQRRRIAKLKTRTVRKSKISVVKDKSKIHYQKMKGWQEIQVKKELGTGFLGEHMIKGGYTLDDVMPRFTLEDLISKGGRSASFQIQKPARYIYKPIIDTTYGFEKVLLRKYGIDVSTRLLRTTRTMPDFYSIIHSGRSLSVFPFAGAGGLATLTDVIPTLDEPIKGYDPIETIKTDDALDLSSKTDDKTMLQDIEEQSRKILPDLTDRWKKPRPEPTPPITIIKPIQEPKQDPRTYPKYKPYPIIIKPVDEDPITTPYPPGFIQEPLPPEPIQEDPLIPPQTPTPRYPEYIRIPPNLPPIRLPRLKKPKSIKELTKLDKQYGIRITGVKTPKELISLGRKSKAPWDTKGTNELDKIFGKSKHKEVNPLDKINADINKEIKSKTKRKKKSPKKAKSKKKTSSKKRKKK